MITQDRLKEILHYDPETGVFTWLVSPSRGTKKGMVAGHDHKSSGYRVIAIKRKLIPAHRLAFLYMTGSIPEFVDHINMIKLDNRWVNLRPATKSENNRNQKLRKDNKSGVKGVKWNKANKKWQVQITVNGHRMHLGLWDDLEAAELVSILAREKYHGEFANYG